MKGDRRGNRIHPAPVRLRDGSTALAQRDVSLPPQARAINSFSAAKYTSVPMLEKPSESLISSHFVSRGKRLSGRQSRSTSHSVVTISVLDCASPASQNAS